MPNPSAANPDANFLYFYHPDQVGSTEFVTDGDGDLFEHEEYFPFGETWVSEASNTQRTPYLFTSKEFDEETQLYYFGARYYDPRTSVWESTDPALAVHLRAASPMGPPIGVFSSANLALYSYAWNSPLVLLDPDGFDESDPWYVRVGKVASGVAYGTVQALAPGGALVDLAKVPSHDSDFLVGKAAGNFATGTVQIIAGSGTAAGGGVVTVGSGGAGGVVGVPAAAAGIAMVVQGGTNVAAAIDTLHMAMSSKGAAGSGGPNELPALDQTGKVHGQLPKPADFGRYTPEELRQLQNELKQSVEERIRTTTDLGPDKPHGERQAAEQELIRQIDKYLEDKE